MDGWDGWDGRTDITKLIVAFLNSANTPTNEGTAL